MMLQYEFEKRIPKRFCCHVGTKTFSLSMQDLQYLSESLEGRSSNPVALLFDTLMHPNADIGEHHPPTLIWRQFPSRAIPHIVLGSGEPGGSWHDMQFDIQSLSLGSWLELPVYSFASWEEERHSHEKNSEGRVSLGDVAQYYSDYVEKVGLQDKFVNGAMVDSVVSLKRRTGRLCSADSVFSPSSECTPEPESSRRNLGDSDLPSCRNADSMTNCVNLTPTTAIDNQQLSEDFYLSCSNTERFLPQSQDDPPVNSCCTSDPDDCGVYCCMAKEVCQCSGYKWSLRATRVGQCGCQQRVVVCAKNLVLATGVNGRPKRLNVSGESLPFVTHRFSDLPLKFPEAENSSHPVVVVGAGLSAADAILLALSRGLTVVHVFYQDLTTSKLIYHKMPPEVYKEYSHIFNLMQGKVKSRQYIARPKHTLAEFKPGGVCVIRSEQDTLTEIVSSLALVLIGSHANLDFLPEALLTELGVHPNHPIHTKHNPVDVDCFTFECEKIPSLYALGPLVGDNFVRFGLGSALGASRHLRTKL